MRPPPCTRDHRWTRDHECSAITGALPSKPPNDTTSQISVERELASEYATRLEIPADERLVVRRRVRYLDGTPVCACLVAAGQAQGRDVVTVEGLTGLGGSGKHGDDDLHPVQQAFLDCGAVQCGFCTPGLLVAAHDLIARNPRPSDPEIREALAGNLCRCTGYMRIFEAVRRAMAG